jgi:hypothetical protein
MNIPRDGKELTAAEVATWSVDRFLDYVETNALPESVRWIVDNKKVADQYGLKLVCCEAGQHFVGGGNGDRVQLLDKNTVIRRAHCSLAAWIRSIENARPGRKQSARPSIET